MATKPEARAISSLLPPIASMWNTTLVLTVGTGAKMMQKMFL